MNKITILSVLIGAFALMSLGIVSADGNATQVVNGTQISISVNSLNFGPVFGTDSPSLPAIFSVTPTLTAEQENAFNLTVNNADTSSVVNANVEFSLQSAEEFGIAEFLTNPASIKYNNEPTFYVKLTNMNGAVTGFITYTIMSGFTPQS